MKLRWVTICILGFLIFASTSTFVMATMEPSSSVHEIQMKPPTFKLPIKAILFDHDDTLVATIQAKWAQHKFIAKTFYGKDLQDDEIRLHWGKPYSVLIRLLYNTDDVDSTVSYNLCTRRISLRSFLKIQSKCSPSQ